MSRKSTQPDPMPLFCPQCGKDGPGASRLCADCGAKLVLKGFCTVCECHWAMPPGSKCPKHEVELISEAPSSALDQLPARGTKWVKVASYPHPYEAEAARLRLNAEGIPAMLDGQRMNLAYPSQLATGGTRLMVPEALEQDARVLLSQSWAAPFGEEEDEPEYDEPASPGERFEAPPESTASRVVLWWGIVVALSMLLLSLLNG